MAAINQFPRFFFPQNEKGTFSPEINKKKTTAHFDFGRFFTVGLLSSLVIKQRLDPTGTVLNDHLPARALSHGGAFSSDRNNY